MLKYDWLVILMHHWESMSLSTNRTHVATHSTLIDLMQEHGLKQIVDKPT